MVCQNCSNEIDQGSSFCKYCGTVIRICQICKKEIDTDGKFCKYCGVAHGLSSYTYTQSILEVPTDSPTSAAQISESENLTSSEKPSSGFTDKPFVALFISFIIIGGIFALFFFSPEFCMPSFDKAEKITLDEYNQIDMGMSYDRVKLLVGSAGEELTRSEIAGYTTFIVVWEGVGDKGANANVTFQNNKVIATAQIGLK